MSDYHSDSGCETVQKSEEQVLVLVGEDERQFHLFKDKLRPLLSPDDVDTLDEIHQHHLPDVSSELFDIFVTWLDTYTLEPMDTNDDESSKEVMLKYLELYLQATEWEIQDLENTIMDHFRLRRTCDDGYFPAFLIKKIYDNTDKDSPLRCYIVDSFVFKSSGWYDEDILKKIVHHFEKGNREFVLDCYKAAVNMDKTTFQKGLDPDDDIPCGYHIHREGKQCNLKQVSAIRKENEWEWDRDMSTLNGEPVD